MPETITASYRITTPMFCSGANQQQAELRLASFKGVLRFWWRSLMWRYTQDEAELHRQEAAIFGASDREVGQSKVRLRWGSDIKRTVPSGEIFENGRLQGAHYLGYGVMTVRGQLTRPMIPGGVFTVRCLLDSSLSPAQRQQVRDALVLVGTVGGMGGKSRKGFGSLTLTELRSDDKTQDVSPDPIGRLKQILGPISSLPSQLPEWTAWSASSKIVVAEENGASACKLLDSLGREQVHYRSWGNGGFVLGQRSEGNFQEDHDLSKGLAVAIAHPKRVAFGLPHNYGKPTSTHVEPASEELDRRASPLFLHIHQQDENAVPIGLAVFLPARFLPTGEQIRAFGSDVPLSTCATFWDPIHGYLNRLTGALGATAKKTSVTGREENLV